MRRKAIEALFEATAIDAEASAEVDRLTATLAAALSGSDAEIARLALANQALRLDAESALAFLDAVEQSPQAAPSHLVEEFVAGKAGATAHGDTTTRAPWRRIANGFRPARRWQVAAACLTVLFASAAVLSLRWGGADQAANPPASVAATDAASSAPAVAAPAAPPPALAKAQRCEPPPQAALATDESHPKAKAGSDCDAAPGDRFADTAVREALQKAEQARQAAAVRAATAAAAKAGAMQADREPTAGHRSDRMFGATAERPAAAAGSVPAAKPAAVPVAPGLR
jgi:hypothetical protein